MNVLLLTIGSSGDVHPFVGLALALRDRGHSVKVITNPFFGKAVTNCGLELVPLGTVEQMTKPLADPALWDSRKGMEVVFNLVLDGLRETYDAIANNVTSDTVLVSSSLGFAGRIAQDKLKIPTAMVHLAPSQFRSLIAPPLLPGLWMPAWLPMWIKRLMWATGDRFFIDKMLGPRINALRAELGLPAVDGILREFWNSPQRVIGLFPDWFGQPQADWPKQTVITGFPRFDEAHTTAIDAELEAFLDAGEAPVVITPGSAMHHGHEFFTAGVEACKKLNRRALLLTKHGEQIPKNLPDTVRHVAYAPFSRLLPRAAAIIHHGGIGTSAQAMAAGCRQLVTPFAHDQFDNAERLRKLGVARVVKAKKYTIASAVGELGSLLVDGQVTLKTREMADRLKVEPSVARTCEVIEALR